MVPSGKRRGTSAPRGRRGHCTWGGRGEETDLNVGYAGARRPVWDGGLVMRMRRRTRWMLAVALFIGLLLAVVCAWPEGKFTWAQYDHIRPGMTEGEVEQ